MNFGIDLGPFILVSFRKPEYFTRAGVAGHSVEADGSFHVLFCWPEKSPHPSRRWVRTEGDAATRGITIGRNGSPALAAAARFSVVALYGPWVAADYKTSVKTPLTALQTHSTRGDFREPRGVDRKT